MRCASLTAVLAIGCGKKDSTDTKNPEQVEGQDTTKTDDENKSDTKNDTEQTDDKKEESEKTKSVMKIYSINMSSGEIQTEDVETDSLNEEKIWSLLQEKLVITSECGMNSSK